MLGFVLLKCKSAYPLTSLLELSLAGKTSDGILSSCFNVANSSCCCQLCSSEPGRCHCHHSHPLVPAPLSAVSASGTRKAERGQIYSLAAAAGSPRCQEKLLVEVGLGCRCVLQQWKLRQVLLQALVVSRVTWEQAARRRWLLRPPHVLLNQIPTLLPAVSLQTTWQDFLLAGFFSWQVRTELTWQK